MSAVGAGTRQSDDEAVTVDAPPSTADIQDRAVRVVLVDDHALVRDGLRSVLAHFDDLKIVAEADNAEAAVKAVTAHEPDVVVLDLQLHHEDGLEVMRALTAQGLDPAVLVLSVLDDPDRVRAVLRAGARGYLLKTERPDELAAGIRRAAARRWVIGEPFIGMLVEAFIGAIPLGVPPVTPREQQVLHLLAEGLPNRAVAERLGISTRTAQKHVENLFKKFNVHGRSELVVVAGRSGLPV
ncbi:MAG TPA: response regulator transcription factor [Euzebyales bacterium]|nr:response regulator transcription factor [Euzebyales bacterium]